MKKLWLIITLMFAITSCEEKKDLTDTEQLLKDLYLTQIDERAMHLALGISRMYKDKKINDKQLKSISKNLTNKPDLSNLLFAASFCDSTQSFYQEKLCDNIIITYDTSEDGMDNPDRVICYIRELLAESQSKPELVCK